MQVRLSAYPVGNRGQVAVGVELATEPWDSPTMRPGEHELARFEVLTTYEGLKVFASDLVSLVGGTASEAKLTGERFVGAP